MTRALLLSSAFNTEGVILDLDNFISIIEGSKFAGIDKSKLSQDFKIISGTPALNTSLISEPGVSG